MPRTYLIKMAAFIAVTTTFLLHTTPVLGSEGAWQPIESASKNISDIEVTPWFLMAGEFNPKSWEGPYNGIFYSTDLGTTWLKLNLKDRGITDLEYSNGVIYAATYYSVSNLNGLFISRDKGKTFIQSGPSKTATNVEVTNDAIFVGTTSNGLWVSKNSGQNWERKIGFDTQYPGSKIIGLVANDHVVISTTSEKMYRSENSGDSWEIISAMANKQLSNFLIVENNIFAGSTNDDGMYISKNLGKTWDKLLSWGDFPTGAIFLSNGAIYASKKDVTNNKIKILKSVDLGETWEETSFDFSTPQSNIVAYAEISTNTDNLYAVAQQDAIYKSELVQKKPELFQFLNIPWAFKNASELVDNITSFFDHTYPLLGYSYFKEPDFHKNTITNFLGLSGKPPEYYYSSHNGIDFSASYGSDILAPADGIARYYYCADCGHSIKIDHQNGYESVFMHMQEKDLITKTPGQKIPVSAGTKIGIVGLTGKVTGPHIHFGINTTKPYPEGVSDPFGWLDMTKDDPWKNFEWTDNLGKHEGATSKYLWNYLIPHIEQYISDAKNKINLENSEIEFASHLENKIRLTVMMTKFVKPLISRSQANLKYVPQTSILVTAKDYFGNNIHELENDARITYALNTLNLTGIALDTLKIYYYDELSELWAPLITSLDSVANTASAITNHFSRFALIGEKLNPSENEITISASGEINDDWFTSYPLITINSTSANIENILYSINDGLSWEEYKQPFIIYRNGLINVLATEQNSIEPNNDLVNKIVKIAKNEIWKSKVTVINSVFETN